MAYTWRMVIASSAILQHSSNTFHLISVIVNYKANSVFNNTIIEIKNDANKTEQTF